LFEEGSKKEEKEKGGSDDFFTEGEQEGPSPLGGDELR